MRRLTVQLVALSFATGCIAAAALALFEQEFINLFTRDPVAITYLHQLWPVLVCLQPVNSLVFVYVPLLLLPHSIGTTAHRTERSFKRRIV
jgi:Na+-driven multidrug efflux pump